MKTEIKYRTFEELLDSVKIDLRGIDLEGMIDDQQLIKVAQRVNYELGLKVNPSRSKTIDILKGRGKLPSDFDVLNFGLHCGGANPYDMPDYNGLWSYKTYDQGLLDGQYDTELKMKKMMVQQFTTIMDIAPGDNIVTHDLNTTSVIVQIRMPDNTLLSFDFKTDGKNVIKIISELDSTIVDARVIVMGTNDNSCFDEVICKPKTVCKIVEKPNCEPSLTDFRNGRRVEYKNLSRLTMTSSTSSTVDCVNTNSLGYHSAYLKNGFLVTNFEEGTVFLNYQSTMEDDEGNLLVMSHPKADEFYEYAIKERIYENLVLAGEDMVRHLQMMSERLRVARNNALSFVNTPDFGEMLKVWRMNRKAMYSKYYDPFKSTYTHRH